MEMITVSLFLAIAEKKFDVYLRKENTQEWGSQRSKDCNDSFTAGAWSIFPARTCCADREKWSTRAWIVQRRYSMY